MGRVNKTCVTMTHRSHCGLALVVEDVPEDVMWERLQDPVYAERT